MTKKDWLTVTKVVFECGCLKNQIIDYRLTVTKVVFELSTVLLK